jgi:hypothetical protein
MTTLVRSFNLSEDQVQGFRRKEVMVLEQIFTPAALRALEEEGAAALTASGDQEGADRSGRPSLGRRPAKVVSDLCCTESFTNLLEILVGPHQCVTHLLPTRVDPEDASDKWRFGPPTLCFVRPQDEAFTIWIPLSPAWANEGSETLWAPREVFSAYSRLQQRSLLYAQLEAGGGLALEAARKKQFGKDANCWSGPFDKAILEANKVGRDFNPGDALIFSRNVWRRTTPESSADPRGPRAVMLHLADGRVSLDKRIVRGFAASLALPSDVRPEIGSFIDSLLSADERLPIKEQPFAAPIAEMGVLA